MLYTSHYTNIFTIDRLIDPTLCLKLEA